MDDTAPLNNIALLIDADNASAAGIDSVLTVLAELGQVNIRRVYGNWAKPGLKNWATLTNRYGLRPQQQFDLTKGKNATDMAMTIDALDLLYQGKVDGFGIMSSDSDFTPLATRLRQDGLVVYGFGNSRTPEAFKTACTRFIDVGALIATDSRESAAPAADDDPPATAAPVDDALIDLLGAAWKAAKRDEAGFASLNEVGNIAGNRSSFDVRNYGFKRLSELMESLRDRFKVERRPDGHLYVRRLR
ncbi:MAG TPA: NYN domain-containing protein [Novosphingobium sp.]|nr:NYN domain-containing protein [Novosphingobium sp.]